MDQFLYREFFPHLNRCAEPGRQTPLRRFGIYRIAVRFSLSGIIPPFSVIDIGENNIGRPYLPAVIRPDDLLRAIFIYDTKLR